MLELLIIECEKHGKKLSLQQFDLGFEIGMWKALRQLFPNVLIRGCRFHLAQNWWWKIQQLQLPNIYRDKENVAGMWLWYCFALPAVCIDNVHQALDELKMITQAEVSKLLIYIEKFYTSENSMCPPSFLAGVLEVKCPSTNNYCENFHRYFFSTYSSPDILTFMNF